MSGGTLTLLGDLSALFVGDSTNGVGTVWVTGGTVLLTNDATFIGFEGVAQMTISNVTMQTSDVYVGELRQLPPELVYRPNVRHAVASKVIGAYQAAAHAASEDPDAPEDVKRAAGLVSGLLAAEQFAELGGPQGVRALVKLAPYGARIATAWASRIGETRYLREEFGAGKPPGGEEFQPPPGPGEKPPEGAPEQKSKLPEWVAPTPEGRAAQSAELEAEAKKTFEGLAGPQKAGETPPAGEVKKPEPPPLPEPPKQQATRDDLHALEDAIGARMMAGAYQNNPTRYAADMSRLERLRKSVERFEGERPIVEGTRVSVTTPAGQQEGTVLGPRTEGGYYAVQHEDGTIGVHDRVEPVRSAAEETAKKAAAVAVAERPDTPATVVSSMSQSDAVRLANTTTASEANALIKEHTGLNSSRWDPEIAGEVADGVQRDPGAFADLDRSRIPMAQTLQQAASWLGMTDEGLLGRLTATMGADKGELSAFLLAINLRAAQLVEDYRSLVISGADAEAAASWSKFTTFGARVSGANSEAGRALHALQQQRTTNVNAAVQYSRVVSSAAKAVRKATGDLDAAKRELAKTTEKAQDAAGKSLAAGSPEAQATAEAWAKRQSRWVSQVERGQKLLDQSVGGYEARLKRMRQLGMQAKLDAIAKAAELRPDDPAFGQAIAMVDPANTRALASLMSRLPNYSRGEAFMHAVMSGYYSGLPGHMRSATGALLNLADEMLTSAAGEQLARVAGVTGRETVFTPGETRYRLAGLLDALRTLPAMAKDYWSYSLTEGAGKVTDIEGVGFAGGRMFTGKWTVMDAAIRLHGLYHQTAWHLIYGTEVNALIFRNAARNAGKGASTETIAAEVVRLRTDLPLDLVKQADLVANDRRYLNEQSKQVEALLKVANMSFNLPFLGRTPLAKAIFVAARFGYGSAARGVEVSGGGIVRAGMLFREQGAVARKAMEKYAKLGAVRELGAEADPYARNAKIKELMANPTPEMLKSVQEETASERDYLGREAVKAGVRGALGAGFLGWGLSLYSDGALVTKNPQTGQSGEFVKLPNGQWFDLRWGWPYTAPLIYAAHLGESVHSSIIKDEHIEEVVAHGIEAMGMNAVSGSMFEQMGQLYEVIRGRASGGNLLGGILAHMAVPGFSNMLRDLDQMAPQSYVRKPEEWWEYVAKNMVLAERLVRPALDPLGNPRPVSPQGLGRISPTVEEEPAGAKKDPTLTFDEGLARQFPDYKPMTTPNVTGYGTGTNRVQFKPEDQYRLTQMIGSYRQQALSALRQDPEFAALPLATQRERWQSARRAAEHAAHRDFATDLALHGDPRYISAYVHMALNANGASLRERSLWVLALQRRGQLTPPIRAQLDRFARPSSKTRSADPTVDEYLAAAPLVEQYLKLPPYLTGNPREWAALADAKSRYSQIKRDHGPDEAQRFFDGNALLQKYDDPSVINDDRRVLLLDHPEVKRYLSGTSYMQLVEPD